MRVVRSDWIELLYVVTAVLVAIAIKLIVETNKIRGPIDDRFPACYSDVCFA